MSSKKDTLILPQDQIPESASPFEVDLSYMFSNGRELKSIKVIWDGHEFWLAEHNIKGKYWTTNTNDPKILNTNKNPPRPRGNVNWNNGGGNPNGKPKGAKNKVTVKAACERMGCNPAEFLAAIVMGNTGELRRHRVKNPNDVTLAQKMKAAETLLHKLVPNLKSVGLDENGEIIPERLEGDADSARSQIQVYIPGSASTVSIEASKKDIDELQENGVASFIKNHEKETAHYDSDNEEEEYVWRLDAEDNK